MKKIIILLALTIATSAAFAQKNPFERFTDMDGVTSVFISKNMLSLLPKQANMQYNGVDVGGFVDKLTSMLIITSENKEIAQEMISLANRGIKESNYELLMRVKSDDGELVNFFMKGKPENIQELIMIVEDEKDESVIMQLLGNFTLQDVQQMTNGFGKK